MFFFFIPILIIALILEGAVTTVPLVLVLLLCLTIIKRDGSVFPVAFFAGFFLDVMTVRTLGSSSLFLILFVLLILLYQRKFEITSSLFVGAAAFFGSILYIALFRHGGWFFPSLIALVFALVIFGMVKKMGYLKQL